MNISTRVLLVHLIEKEEKFLVAGGLHSIIVNGRPTVQDASDLYRKGYEKGLGKTK